ncbi:MAG TPA: NADH-quinone oxidoreductase subunit L, partial [Chitinophagaceae bacterium]|nr:NADH-quinone oxidoreductase subunit L [Chitinophagaceae bacterium]
EPVLAVSNSRMPETASLDHATEYVLMAVSVAGALIAAIIAYLRYVRNSHVPVADTEERNAIARLSYHKFYIDEIYDRLITRPLNAASSFFYQIVDRSVIDGFVNGLGKLSTEASKGFRLLQTGNIGFYIFMMVAGIVALLVYGFYNI